MGLREKGGIELKHMNLHYCCASKAGVGVKRSIREYSQIVFFSDEGIDSNSG